MLWTRRELVVGAVGLYCLVALCVGLLIWHGTGGHLVYTLDDAYIHMAVARQIAVGHYGINAAEFSSPSSSALWPLLLAPFARTSFALYWPLVLNIAAGIGSAALLASSVADWPQKQGQKARQVLALLALMLIANLIGTTFLGMEHGVQVLLAIACGVGLCRALGGRPLPWWAVCAAALAPAIRYEDLILTLAVAVVLLAERRRSTAVCMLSVAVLPLITFSWFLHRHGLPFLPVSVLVKGKAASAHLNPVLTVLRLLASGTFHALTDTARWPLLLLAVMLATAARRETDRLRRRTLAAGSIALVLHLLVGRFGWFHRYELYALVFGSVLVLRLLAERPAIPLEWYGMGLVALCSPYLSAIPESVLSAEDVYAQQLQMSRFAAEFYTGNVAVNDLGAVSFGIPRARYVLDLGGLASLETAREPKKDAAWLDSLTRRHGVGVVMMYPGLLPVPPEWVRLGQVCNVRPVVALGGACVNYFATRPEEAVALEEQFAAFARTLPRHSEATLGRSDP